MAVDAADGRIDDGCVAVAVVLPTEGINSSWDTGGCVGVPIVRGCGLRWRVLAFGALRP